MQVRYATLKRRTCVGRVSWVSIGDIGVNEPGIVLQSLSQEVAVITVQPVPGKIHRDPADIVHCVYVKLAQCAATAFVFWRETCVGLFGTCHKLEVQCILLGAELDDKCSTDDGVTSCTLDRCWVDRCTCDAFSLCVAFLLRRARVPSEEIRYLLPR